MSSTQPHDHVPQVPFWFKFIITAKIVIAVAVLGLASYVATFNDFFAGNGYAIFCCIALSLTEAYYLVTTNFFTAFFNAWIYLVISFFQAVWWLACWANLASWASAYKLYYIGSDLSDFEECSQSVANDTSDSTSQFVAAAAGIGALEWILVVVTLTLFALALNKHRKSGAPFSAGAAWRTTSDNPHGVAGGAHAEQHQMHANSKTTV